MRRVWAVAKNTVRQALRMKVALAFVVLLLVLLPIMSQTMTGDGTLKGRLQTFVSYSLSLTSFLLCLLTIIVSVYAVTSDIENKQIYTVVTKPIRRHEIVLGKLLGVIVLDAALLAIFTGAIYGFAWYMPKLYRATDEELTQLKNEFFTARASVLPTEPDVSDLVRADYKKLVETERLAELYPNFTEKEILSELRDRHRLASRAAGVGGKVVRDFRNIRLRGADENLYIRFKYEVAADPPDSVVYGSWRIRDPQAVGPGGSGSMGYGYTYRIDRPDPIRTFREIAVPAGAVPDDGDVQIEFQNPPLTRDTPGNMTTVMFPLEDGLELLYKADSFSANYARAVVMIFCRLIFLACLGTLAATFLSFPVAILLCLFVFLAGTVSGFLTESVDSLGGDLHYIYSYSVALVIKLLPRFDEFSPAKYLVPGRLLSWSVLGRVVGVMVFTKSLLLLLLALLVFSYKELARIVV